jgi:hypothetical protein
MLRWRNLRWVLGAAAVPMSLWACSAHKLEAPIPVPETQTDIMYDVNPIRKLDLVFMIDDSDSMSQEQGTLRNNFPVFMNELQNVPGGLPDIRVAVISSNVGAGPGAPSDSCPPLGDRGRFLVKPGCGLDPAQAHWIAIDGKGNKNFTGDLAAVFSCMANLGTAGCGYEHQLQSIRAALSETNNIENRGFIREDAYLGIIILSDEDDCSGTPDSMIFDENLPGQAFSLRCATHGVACGNGPVKAENGYSAPLSTCKPLDHDAGENRTKLINVQEFIDFVKGVKQGRTDRVIVSGIIGWNPDPQATLRVEQFMRNDMGGMRTELDLAPACNSANGNASPGVRLKTFVDAFGENAIYSICQADLREAMKKIGQQVAAKIANTCITQPLVDTNIATPAVDADCQVVDRKPKTNGPGYTDQVISPCTAGVLPCWEIQQDGMCAGSGYRVVVKRKDNVLPPPGTLQGIKCLTCTDTRTNDPRCKTAR